ncbi:MAG: hypothetical protein R2857_06475 [Vampirovibrionales bacterium]
MVPDLNLDRGHDRIAALFFNTPPDMARCSMVAPRPKLTGGHATRGKWHVANISYQIDGLPKPV